MPVINQYEQYYAKDRKAWRAWLKKHHGTAPGVWLVYYKKGSGKTRVPYADAVEEALCFGWIDSTSRPLDEERYMQLFTPRKPKSVWSALNKQRVERLIADGLMTEAGLEKIAISKSNGYWEKTDHVEAFIVPEELAKELKKSKTARVFYESLGKTNKKLILYWLSNAKRQETRAKRIEEIMASLKKGVMPERFRTPSPKHS